MVLKVVRGKILETLKLSCCSTTLAFAGIGRLQRLAPEVEITDELSKIVDHLADNLCAYTLSEVKAKGQGKSSRGSSYGSEWGAMLRSGTIEIQPSQRTRKA